VRNVAAQAGARIAEPADRSSPSMSTVGDPENPAGIGRDREPRRQLIEVAGVARTVTRRLHRRDRHPMRPKRLMIEPLIMNQGTSDGPNGWCSVGYAASSASRN
jgi:hypothetical protein